MSTKQTLDNMVNVVCSYLRIDQNLFFCSKHCIRVVEAKKYVSYFAVKNSIPAPVVAKYLGCDSEAVNKRSVSVYQSLKYNRQIVNDIEELSKIIN